MIPVLQEDAEELILRDNNLVSIRGTKEYQTNLSELTPTNRILTSLFLPVRFLKLLKYGFAYVERTDKDGIKTLQKHIMRYPQFLRRWQLKRSWMPASSMVLFGIPKGVGKPLWRSTMSVIFGTTISGMEKSRSSILSLIAWIC